MRPGLRERAALIALLQRPDADWAEVTDAVMETGSALGVLDGQLRGSDTLFPDDDAVDDAAVEGARLIEGWQTEGIGVHAFFDETYLARLRGIREMPPVLFTRGTLADDTCSVAVVGTRQASEQGIRRAASVAEALVSNGVTVVSGLAAGIDTAAHEAALRAGGRTVAVLGTGIRNTYPSSNAHLQHTIARRGLVVSQFWPDAPPTRSSFPMRNAVMSGYAAATVVVEAPWRSGARIQARLALGHGRPVVFPAELLSHDWAREYARRPGVHVVRDTDELIRVTGALIAELRAGPDALPETPGLAWH